MTRRIDHQSPTGRRSRPDRRNQAGERRRADRREGQTSQGQPRTRPSRLKTLDQKERLNMDWSAANFKSGFVRYLLTAFAFPLGALILLLMNHWYEGFKKTATEHEADSRLPKITVSAGKPRDPVNDMYRIPEETFTMSQLGLVPGKGFALLPGMTCTPVLRQRVAFALPGGIEVTRELAAFGPNARTVFPGLPTKAQDGTTVPDNSGKPYDFGSTQTVTISADLAAELKIKPGTPAALLPRNTRVNPEAADVTLHPVYSENPYNSGTLYGPYGLALCLLDKIDDTNPVLKDLIMTELDCTFPDSMDPAVIAARIQAKHPQFKVSTFADRSFYLRELDRGARTLQIITTLVIGLMSIFGAYSFASSSLSEREEEIHSMSRLGMTPAEIGKIIRREYQAAILGGSTLYTGLGLAWGEYLNRVGVDLATVGMTEGGPALGFPLSYQVYGQNNYIHALIAWVTVQVLAYGFLRAGIGKFVQYPKVPIIGEALATESEQASGSYIGLRNVGLNLGRDGVAQQVLNIAGLSIKRGEFVVVMGPSGGGKTTLLELLGGFLQPSQGEIVINGQTISGLVKPSQRQAARKKLKLATISQDLGLFSHLTVRQTIEFALRAVQGTSVKEAKEKANKVIESMDLKELQAEKVDNLSGGEKARVAIARALAFDPEILLVDEATKSLDVGFAREFEDMLDELKKKGLTIVEVSHRDVAVRENRTVLWLDRGRLEDLPDEYLSMLNTSGIIEKRQQLSAAFLALGAKDPALHEKIVFGVRVVGAKKLTAFVNRETAELAVVQALLQSFQAEHQIEVAIELNP